MAFSQSLFSSLEKHYLKEGGAGTSLSKTRTKSILSGLFVLMIACKVEQVVYNDKQQYRNAK